MLVDNLIQTESWVGAAPLRSAKGRASQRAYGWLRIAAVALALTALLAPVAQAGVEFVTTTGSCNKVDEIGDGKDLFIIAGPDVRFRVFGNSVDLSNPSSGFRIASDGGTGTVSARIVSQGQDCGGTGFALVEVDSPLTLSSSSQWSLFFKMPLGDESRLQINIKPYPTINVTWTSVQNDISCIVKTGTFEKLDQDKKIRITLPPGHQQDQTTCNSRTLAARVSPSAIGELDIATNFRYTVVGLPSFMTSNQTNAVAPTVAATISFPIDVAGIRALGKADRRDRITTISTTTTSNSTITIRSLNTNRTSTLNLEVVPNLSNGFTEVASCRNLQTGDIVNVDDLVQCELRLATPPPGAGQLITFEAQDRLCVAAGAPSVSYASASGIGTTTLTGTGTIFEVPLRALSGSTSANTPCASQTGVQHTLKFWIGQRDTATPDTQDTFRTRSQF
jgi:hypothetical protein